MLDDLGLIPALEWQGREVSRQSGLRVDISADSVSDDLPEEHKTCVYRVVQEALANVSRHARATSVRIVAEQERSRLLLTIQDDGCGFDVQRSKGLGLLGMEERVSGMGGRLRIHSEADRGTLISVVLPLEMSAGKDMIEHNTNSARR
jgi:signal transduction histidine kinase